MGRRNEPWYWEARGEWFVKINGKRERLGPDKDAAFRKFHALKSKDPDEEPKQPEPVGENAVVAILDDFLDWTKREKAASTFLDYKWRCESFCKMFPTLTVSELTAAHVTTWLKSHESWNSTSRANAIKIIKRGLNWAVKNRGLDKNPIAGMDKPESQTRTETLTPKEFTKILQKSPDRAFRDLLVVSWDAGARPQEIKALEARHIDVEKCRAVLPTKESKGKRQPRAIYFPTQRAMNIIKDRMERFPDGKLFRNTRGNPWTADAVKCRFDRLEEKIGRRVCQYMFRHTWITRKLIAGVDSHVVAKLSGHTDTSMIDKVYGHIADDYDFMLEQAQKERERKKVS